MSVIPNQRFLLQLPGSTWKDCGVEEIEKIENCNKEIHKKRNCNKQIHILSHLNITCCD